MNGQNSQIELLLERQKSDMVRKVKKQLKQAEAKKQQRPKDEKPNPMAMMLQMNMQMYSQQMMMKMMQKSMKRTESASSSSSEESTKKARYRKRKSPSRRRSYKYLGRNWILIRRRSGDRGVERSRAPKESRTVKLQNRKEPTMMDKGAATAKQTRNYQLPEPKLPNPTALVSPMGEPLQQPPVEKPKIVHTFSKGTETNFIEALPPRKQMFIDLPPSSNVRGYPATDVPKNSALSGFGSRQPSRAGPIRRYNGTYEKCKKIRRLMMMRFFSKNLLDRLYTGIELKYSQYKTTLQRLRGPAVDITTNKLRVLLTPLIKELDAQKPSPVALFLPPSMGTSQEAQTKVVDTLVALVKAVHSEYQYTQRTVLDDPETIKFIGYYSWLNCFLPDGFLYEYELARLRLNTQGSTGDITASQTKFLATCFFMLHVVIPEILLDSEHTQTHILEGTDRCTYAPKGRLGYFLGKFSHQGRHPTVRYGLSRILRYLAGYLFHLTDIYFVEKEENGVIPVADYRANVIEKSRVPTPDPNVLQFGGKMAVTVESTSASSLPYEGKKSPIFGVFGKFEITPLIQNDALCERFYSELKEFANEIFTGVVLVRMTVEALQISKKVQVVESTAKKLQKKHPEYAAGLQEYAASLKESYNLA